MSHPHECSAHSTLDYCNSHFHNIFFKDITTLQCVQNYYASVVIKSPRVTDEIPLLKYLQWLPVRHRIISDLYCYLPGAFL
ncbi:hypothetical protein NP493_243g01061 [Ridgeia piscesae]|uniref:Uncharacterized protein n=1 Tax=Ridgeia piscesae TaxID=27915 RepID=A0AAD9NZ90_RIDPI|nr:hypothetical protein NP493_243g01061 [Ridgeia piscesae]